MDEKITSDYYGQKYVKNMEGALEKKEDTIAKFENIIRLVDPQKGEKILDIGCGTGHYSSRLSESGSEVSAIDFSIDALEIAKKFDSFFLIRGSVESLPIRDRYFDKAIMIDTIEHLYHPLDSLNEVYQILKPGGKFIITTMPNNVELVYLFAELLKKLKIKKENFLDEPCHVSLYNPLNLKNYLKKSGFKIEKISTYRILGPLLDIMGAYRNDLLDTKILCNTPIGYFFGHGILIKAEK